VVVIVYREFDGEVGDGFGNYSMGQASESLPWK